MPVDDPHFLYASDGASAVEQALKIAFQYWANPATVRDHGSSCSPTPTTATPSARSPSATVASVPTCSIPLRFPVVRAPGSDPECFDDRRGLGREHADELAAVIIEPLVQGAAGMQIADRDGVAELGRACREHGVLLICDEVATGFGRTGTMFASELCGVRPDLLVLGKGLTGGYLPMSATVASGRVFDAFLGADLGERTLYHGHSYSGNALAAAVALRHLELLEAWAVLANVRERSEELRGLLTDRIARPNPAVCDVRLVGLMGGVELAPPRTDMRWGRRVCAAAVERGVLLRPLGDVVGAHAAAHRHLTRVAPHRARARRRARRGHHLGPDGSGVSDAGEPACPSWPDWADHEAKRVREAQQWREPRDLDLRIDAPGPSGTLAPDGVEVVSFASNDYLGLTRASHGGRGRAPRRSTGGVPGPARRGSSSARGPVHSELERALAAWKGTERAVLFTTGFAANLGVLVVCAGPDVLVCSDELNHASIIDGRRLAHVQLAVFEHRDMAHLDRLLGHAGARRALVVSETVFSMDGDVAPVDDLVDVCGRHGALLVLDEAHAVLGPRVPGRRARTARGHALEDPRRPGWLRGRSRPLHRAAREPGPVLHLHDRVHARRRGRRGSPRSV